MLSSFGQLVQKYFFRIYFEVFSSVVETAVALVCPLE